MTPDSQIYIEAHSGIPLAPSEPIKPKAGDLFLGETLVLGRDQKTIYVDQMAIEVEEIRPKGTVAVKMTAVTDGKVLVTEVSVSDIVHHRCGMYDLTRKLGKESTEVPPSPASNWRALERSMGLRRR